MKRIVVTGGGGHIGSVIVDGLKKTGNYEVISAAHHPNAERGEIPLDVCDLQSCIDALKGADMVVHMAFWLQNDDFVGKSVPTNIIGTYNLFEAARINGVQRIVFGSSNHVYGFYPVDAFVCDYAEYRPDSIYGLSKCCAETIGRYYSDRFGISCFNIRIGHCRGTRSGYAPGARECKQWLSNRDAVQLVMCCLEADPSILYKCMAGTSNNTGNYWDIGMLKDEIGYDPQDDGSEMITVDTNRNETEYKGGKWAQKEY